MNYNNPFYYPLYDGRYPYFENFMPADKPPTLYALLNSYLNFNAVTKTSISNFASQGRGLIFDFEYTLSNKVTKKDFEEMFIDHFLDRRIGTETLLAFKIHLRSRLREILPYYNKLFDAIDALQIIYNESYTKEINETVSEEGQEVLDRDTVNTAVTDGEKTDTGSITHTGTDTHQIADNIKFSDTPQNQLTNVANDRYLTDYTMQNTSDTDTKNLTDTSNKTYTDDTTVTDTGTDDYTKDNTRSIEREYTEEVSKTYPNQIENYQKYLETRNSIFTLLFNDLDCLFYQLV